MKTLIAEDDFTSRKVLQAFLAPYGECDVAVDGKEAIQAFRAAHAGGNPYDLVCLDLMMPKMDGHRVLAAIRETEDRMTIHGSDRVRVVITTRLSDSRNVLKAFKGQCEAYLVKPIDRRSLIEKLKELDLVDTPDSPPNASRRAKGGS